MSRLAKVESYLAHCRRIGHSAPRTTNSFIDDYDLQLASTILPHYIVALMTTGDISLSLNNGYSHFFESCAPDYIN